MKKAAVRYDVQRENPVGDNKGRNTQKSYLKNSLHYG
jgi:hypothetical protein